ncbi:hypothetical protein CDL15_Pgr028757 [Punica granatum]|uniref:Uncharacterized protein n=1 Tax=Punica granatum TaxID=22663 RepID=A0A218VXN1_PUNGR|nr:hypothetical protein CDL15_Pgr028757 [Punica granatum]
MLHFSNLNQNMFSSQELTSKGLIRKRYVSINKSRSEYGIRRVDARRDPFRQAAAQQWGATWPVGVRPENRFPTCTKRIRDRR